VPVIEDQAALYAHVRKTGEFDLLQRRLAEGAVLARWAEARVIPGVGARPVLSWSVKKRKKGKR
jgi:hypothetical protein